MTLGYGIKTVTLSWGAVAGATSYQVFEDPDGVSGYSLLATGITATSYEHGIFLPRRLNARYIVAACNSAGCTDSAAATVSSTLVEAIGYAKASNTGSGDYFGWALALSADGHTLAVGALGEDSNATGSGGDESNNSAPGAGAVYVFTRSGSVWTQQAYLKASNTGSYDWFGRALALSADGHTLAVGAYDEDSNATGIGGDAGNNSAPGAGAVYLY